jgi:Cu/Ag efflux protein CusF
MKSKLSLGKSLSALLVTGAITGTSLLVPHSASAQATTPVVQNAIPQSDEVTLQAKIKSINEATRAVKLVGPTGETVTVIAGPGVRLNLLKPGQTVNAQYFRSVAFTINPPQGGNGVPVSNDQWTQVTAQPVQAPGGVVVQVVKISGTVVSIDLAANTIGVVNPSGGLVTEFTATDPARIAALSSLKVGDTVTAIISQVLAVSIEPAKKRWF